MKVVLIQNVKKLGKVGDVVNVSDGYARNFLFSKNLAQMATPDVLKKVEKNKADMVASEKEETEKLNKLAREIKDKKIVIVAKSKGGKLFGSIDANVIAQELKKQLNLEIDKSCIKLEAPIKMVGEKKVTIEFLKSIKTNINVEVKEEK